MANKGGSPANLVRTGRPKGVPNKTTRTALEAITLAAEGLGGAARLQEWAGEHKDNEKIFWGTIYPKLLPLQVSGANGAPLIIQLSATDALL